MTDGDNKIKAKKDSSKGKAKKKKKNNDKEALEDSDDGDYEGLEVDYMSDESRSQSHQLLQVLRNVLLFRFKSPCVFCK